VNFGFCITVYILIQIINSSSIYYACPPDFAKIMKQCELHNLERATFMHLPEDSQGQIFALHTIYNYYYYYLYKKIRSMIAMLINKKLPRKPPYPSAGSHML